MFCTRFWRDPAPSKLFCLLAALVFWVGCDSAKVESPNPSPDSEVTQPVSQETSPSQGTFDAASSHGETGSADAAESPSHLEASQVNSPEEMSPPALAPLPSPAELEMAAPPANETSPVLPPLPKPGESAEVAEAAEESAVMPTLEPEPKPVASPDDKAIQAADSPRSPLPRKQVEEKSPRPFSENPLREGTDDFPAVAGMEKPVIQPPDSSEAAPSGIKPVAETPEKARKKPSQGKHSGETFDPIAANGEIFVGWKKPKLALLISGRQDGYLEPCGCAGLDRMKGGLTRRHSLFKQLEADGWPVVGLDVGGLVKGFGRQAELKFHLSVDAMQKMGYDAIALGKSDLRLPAGELLSRVASSEGAPSPFLSANVAVFGFDAKMTANHRIVDAGGLRIGITAVLGSQWQKEINNTDVEMAAPEAKLREILPSLKERSDLLVLLAHATMEESKSLAKAFPEFDIVVTGGGNPEPPEHVEILPRGTNPRGTIFVEVGEKGMNAIVLGIYDDGVIKDQRVPLDSRFEDSRDMKEFMRQYQQQLKADGLAGLGIRQVPHPRAEELGRFVGSKECESCHEPSYDVWKKTGHSDAWKTLVELEVPRNYDPECISCHVVGWHPTEYFPYEGGFLSEEETPELVDVGCESCHGPGEKHVKAEMGSDEELQKKLQKAMRVTKEQAQHDKNRWCLNCHDLDNSPDFNFEEYWPNVEHSEDIWEDEK